MNSPSGRSPVELSIASVERDTGLSKDTLRVWERRYGFPQPGRDHLGERTYPLEQVEKLRLVKRLLDAGHRPGRIVGLPVEALQTLSDQLAPLPEAAAPDPVSDLEPMIGAIYQHDVPGLRRMLTQRLATLGLSRFIVEVAAPLNRFVGDAWLRGRMQVYEEHAYTESLQVVLRHALHTLPAATSPTRPLALLSTLPGEQHGMGLLMVECLLTLHGCRCISLGVQTPVWDMVLAAGAHGADLVVLSFSGVMNPNLVVESLTELRTKLPQSVEVWVGGSAPIIHRRSIDGIRALSTMDHLATAVQAWRNDHPDAASIV